MSEPLIEIFAEHPHYSTEEVFLPPSKLIRGFTEESYNKKLHSQEFYEINIVMRGSANHYIGQRKITVSAGDTFIVPPNVMHGYDGSEGFDVYHILIHPRFLEKNSAELQRLSAFPSLFKIDPLMREKTSAKLHFRLTENEIDMLTPRLDTLTSHSKSSEAVDCIISNGEALIIIAELCSIYERHTEAPQSYENDDTAFLSSIAHIYENYGEKLTVPELARIARMSRNAYIAKFKRITGHTPAKFLKLHRVDVVKQMLTETSRSEAEIALAVGCCDTSHLIKMFCSEIGVTPSEYRKR